MKEDLVTKAYILKIFGIIACGILLYFNLTLPKELLYQFTMFFMFEYLIWVMLLGSGIVIGTISIIFETIEGKIK